MSELGEKLIGALQEILDDLKECDGDYTKSKLRMTEIYIDSEGNIHQRIINRGENSE